MKLMACCSIRSFMALFKASRPSRAQQERGEPHTQQGAKVLILYGDSNFTYVHWDTLSTYLGSWWAHESTADLVRAELRGRAITASCLRLKYVENSWNHLLSCVETLLYLSPNAEVHMLVLTGQNDADSASRKSTRNFCLASSNMWL